MSAARPGLPPFLITVATGDGEAIEIPAADGAELSRLLGRISAVCEGSRVPTPPTAVLRRDRGRPRLLSDAELGEWDLGRRPRLSD